MTWWSGFVQLAGDTFDKHKRAKTGQRAWGERLVVARGERARVRQENDGLNAQLTDLRDQQTYNHLPVVTNPKRYAKYVRSRR